MQTPDMRPTILTETKINDILGVLKSSVKAGICIVSSHAGHETYLYHKTKIRTVRDQEFSSFIGGKDHLSNIFSLFQRLAPLTGLIWIVIRTINKLA